jgi:hypothetical protein
MTRSKTIAIALVVSILIGCAALFIALPEFASTKDRYTLSPFLFPYAFLLRHLILSRQLFFPLILAQFPAYGIFYALAWRKRKSIWSTTWILTTHFALAVTASLLCRVDAYTDAGYWPFDGCWPY